MRFMRLLTVGLMALICAGTATAASQLNSVQVAASDKGMTVSLRTTGSFAHKEYRADEHLVLIDLTGVTTDASVERTATLKSAVLAGYKLSSYTGASGIEVTRLELRVGDGVRVDVQDQSSGLLIVLKSGEAPVLSSSPAPSAASAPAAPKPAPATPTPAPATASNTARPVPAYAVPVVKDSYIVSPANPKVAAAPAPAVNPPAARPTQQPAQSPAKPTSGTPAQASVQKPSQAPAPAPAGAASIRSVSVRRGKGTLDVVVDGPSSAHPFLLKNPDRLVVDFNNAVVKTAAKTIAVHDKDVLQIRVGRFKAEPPVSRIVIDLSGPREFEVVPSANQVVVKIKSEDVAVAPAPHKAAEATVPPASRKAAEAEPPVQNKTTEAAMPPAPRKVAEAAPAPKKAAPVPAPAPAPVNQRVVAEQVIPRPSSIPQNSQTADVTPASAPSMPRKETAAMPAADSTSRVREVENHNAKVADATAAAPMPALPQRNQAAAEVARLSAPSVEPAPGSTPAAAAPKYTGEPISVNLKDVDLKDFFRLIHEISGLNIVLDPNVRGNVTLVLDDVPWDQALDIVLKNNALDRELQGNVLRIAATDTLRKEAVDRRAQSEAIALAVDRQTVTRFLSYAKAREVVPTIKKFLTARGDVISDERTNAVIISDIPSVLPNLDRLISQLDKKSQEVEIEVRVVSATRSFSRDLGFQLGLSWGNGVTTIAGSNPNGSNTSTSTTSTGSSSGSSSSSSSSTTNSAATQVPLFTNFPVSGATTGFSISNITKSYGIDAILTAAENHNLAKVLSRPRVVTQSNVRAEVKQGSKLPVYQAGTANANATVSYIDAVLRLSVTPQITSDNTIFLTVDVENTQPSGQNNGNYILTTQQTSTQVLVTDGGTVVIGGVIQTTNSVSTTQTPVLGNIPWLGNLFKERKVETNTQELIFFITPKIIQT